MIIHAAGIGIATAQTDPITPSGLNTQVNLSTSPTVPVGSVQYDITGGTRPGGGENLFHSFGEFGIPLNHIANFLNDTALPTSNILARITGTNGNNPTLSSIYGTIQTTGFENANLFLMNPAGFLFGPNATVNVGGMVAFTSADYLKLTDNVRFNAIPNAAADALLTALPVASFGFLGSNPGAITVQGSQFTVTDGQSISLVGGNISIGSGTPNGGTAQPAQLSAPNGILLASAASPGEFDAATLQPLLNVDGASFTSFGSVALLPGSNIDVSGANTVSIRGGQFVLSVNDATLTTSESPAADTIILSQGSSIMTSSSGVEPGADVQISAGTLQMDGAFILSSALSEGKGGDIQVSAQNVTLNTAFIGTTASAVAAGGDLTVTAVKAVDLQGGSVLFSSTISTDSTQNGGNIFVHGNTVALRDGSTIFSESQGSSRGGTITVTAEESMLITSPADAEVPSLILSTAGQNLSSGEDTTGDGGAVILSAPSITIGDTGTVMTQTSGSAKAGDITVHTASDLTMTNAGSIVSSTGGSGLSGTIQITAGGTVSLVGNFDADTSSRIVSSSGSIGDDAGESGDISIDANRVTLNDGARIFSDTVNAAAGDILIQAHDSVLLSGGSRITARNALQDAGSLSISGSSITVEGLGTGLSTQSIGPGNAGDISLIATSGSLILSGGSDIKSLTGQGTGAAGAIMASAANSIEISGGATLTSSSFGPAPSGPITLSADNIVSLSGSGTGVFSEAFGTGDGGNISINGTHQVQLANGAIISARSGPVQGTTGTGNAGNIQINAGNQFVMTDSSVTTEATLASGGIIKITTTPNGTVELNNSTISASVLDGAGGGGSVDIDPQYVLLQNSQILAQAVQGPGGNITITITNGGLFLPDANSTISASSQFGVNGTVTIQSPNAPASGQIQPLGNSPLLATSLLNQHCAALAGGEFSSFTVAGRDSLPTEPGSWLASPLYAAGVGLGIKSEGVKAEGERLETPLLSLRQIAPAGFLTQAFAVDWSASCQS